jgi:hypothetical protein
MNDSRVSKPAVAIIATSLDLASAFGAPTMQDITSLSAAAMHEAAEHARLAAPLLRLQPIPYRPVPLRRRRH